MSRQSLVAWAFFKSPSLIGGRHRRILKACVHECCSRWRGQQPRIVAIAFQANAFQNNAFQIIEPPVPRPPRPTFGPSVSQGAGLTQSVQNNKTMTPSIRTGVKLTNSLEP